MAAGLLAPLLAAFVLHVGWERRTNRILAAALITEGVAQSGGPLVFVLPPAAASVFWAATPSAAGLFPFVYRLPPGPARARLPGPVAGQAGAGTRDGGSHRGGGAGLDPADVMTRRSRTGDPPMLTQRRAST